MLSVRAVLIFKSTGICEIFDSAGGKTLSSLLSFVLDSEISSSTAGVGSTSIVSSTITSSILMSAIVLIEGSVFLADADEGTVPSISFCIVSCS